MASRSPPEKGGLRARKSSSARQPYESPLEQVAPRGRLVPGCGDFEAAVAGARLLLQLCDGGIDLRLELGSGNVFSESMAASSTLLFSPRAVPSAFSIWNGMVTWAFVAIRGFQNVSVSVTSHGRFG